MSKYVNRIRKAGYRVILNPEKIYWNDSFRKSIAFDKRIDIRTRGKRKPILIIGKNIRIIIEWDYGYNGWIIYNANNGDIIGKESTKSLALITTFYYLTSDV
jgi:hypothetical protein